MPENSLWQVSYQLVQESLLIVSSQFVILDSVIYEMVSLSSNIPNYRSVVEYVISVCSEYMCTLRNISTLCFKYLI